MASLGEARQVLERLATQRPVPPSVLPDAFGIYALWDHTNAIRYIGCTPKATEGFRVRVANKHVTGSEGRSHKFSDAYCVGAMWRYCKRRDPAEFAGLHDPADGSSAKRLRTLFIRQYCGVTYVEVRANASDEYWKALTALEADVQDRAPPSMRLWEGVRFQRALEPAELVDELLERNPEQRHACLRQRLRCRSIPG